MKIAFVCPWNAADPNLMSGYAYSMREAFVRMGHDVVDVFPLADPLPRYTVSRIAARLRGQYYNVDRRVERLKDLALAASRRLSSIKGLDLVFSPSSLPVSHLFCDEPLYFSTDQTFVDLLDGYVKNSSAAYRMEGLAQEQAALERAAGALYPSYWARESALRNFRVSPDKVHVVPWGANLPVAPEREAVLASLATRLADPVLRLCFVAREWERKGGDAVLATLRLLKGSGMDVHLTVVGVNQPVPEDLPVHVIPSLNKADPADFRRWLEIMQRSHVLFVPSRAEAYGQVFCEAAAYAMPSVTRSVGGIPTIVKDGQTGICLAQDATPADFAARITSLWTDRAALEAMSLAARRRFEDDLNWDAFARSSTAVFTGQTAVR
jgi:glycosyltransferase involved in cell wall biosynthesis